MRPWVIGLLLACAVSLVYTNTLHGLYLYDDNYDILSNSHLFSLVPLKQVFLVTGKSMTGLHPRPFVALTFAMNWAMGAGDPVPFHLTNLLGHTLATLLLFGLLRRVCLTHNPRTALSDGGILLAASAAFLWGLHPLQTESVSYITQRYESLMGLFFLGTLYGMVRMKDGRHSWFWGTFAAASCLLALLSKEVAVCLPLLALLFDRTFLSGGFKESLRRHWGLYVAMAVAWGLFLVIQLKVPPRSFAGGETLLPWWRYLISQFGVLLHYIRLALWPNPLVIDYLWPAATRASEVLPGAILVGALLCATIWALFRKPILGFLGASFFLVLAPTSSFMPILDLAVEHRMYLPLAPVIVALLLLFHWLFNTLCSRFPSSRSAIRTVSFCLFSGLIGAFASMTFIRNEDYRGPTALWTDTVSKMPRNPRAHLNLAMALEEDGRLDEAIRHLKASELYAPDRPYAFVLLGELYGRLGRPQESLEHLRRAISINPREARAWNSIAMAYLQINRVEKAQECLRVGLAMDPRMESIHCNLAQIFLLKGDQAACIASFEEAIRLNPSAPSSYRQYGMALLAMGRAEAANHQFKQAAALERRFRPHGEPSQPALTKPL